MMPFESTTPSQSISRFAAAGWPVHAPAAVPAGVHVGPAQPSQGDRCRPGKRLLFISYAFPPTGGGGVQRSVKFAKFLPACGWEPTILTAANPSVPVTDDDLQREVDSQLRILRARTLEPGYRLKSQLGATSTNQRHSLRGWLRRVGMNLLQPDPQRLWNPAAYRMAKRELVGVRYDAVYVTGPPFSSFLLGCAIKQRFGLPLIVDFRDEWMLASEHLDNYSLGRFSRGRQTRMMKRVLQQADAVIATTQASLDEIIGYAHHCGARPAASCIYNGYDPDDLPSPDRVRAVQASGRHADRLTVVYTGTLWKLTDIEPLVKAVQRMSELAPSIANRLDLVLVGRRTAQQDKVVQQLKATPVSVQCHDYLPHRQSLELAAAADVLLLLLADQPGAGRVVPAKLFEYLALGKPILSISPRGETDQILRQHGRSNRFLPNQIEEIAHWLLARIPATQVRHRMDPPGNPALECFSRRSLTRQLATLLDQVVSPKVPSG
jgi:glycosyltransferase involved in cell wall biosynthesis